MPSNPGVGERSRNGRRRLTDEDIATIRALFRPGQADALAQTFDVDRSRIYQLVKGLAKPYRRRATTLDLHPEEEPKP